VVVNASDSSFLNIILSSNIISQNDVDAGINIITTGNSSGYFKATCNNIYDNGKDGVKVYVANGLTSGVIVDFGGGMLGSIGYNSIYGHQAYDFDASEGIALEAKYNWWGQDSGPDLDKISGLDATQYTPWLRYNPHLGL
jgi:hypothetical protein